MNQALKHFLDEHPDLNLIFMTKFGSHLFGTSTPDSDIDIKGIYLPSKNECFLGEVQNSFSYTSGEDDSKNTKDDIDIELYSLQYYLKLLQKGDTGAIDMLHAPVSNKSIVMYYTGYWMWIWANRSQFYTKNMSAFVGYCRKQANKYSQKGSRLSSMKKVIDFFENISNDTRLDVVWDQLPQGEHINVIPADPENGVDFDMYQVCGRKMQRTVTVEYAYDILKKVYDDYGHRAQKAAQNEGIDWKAVSHAARVAYEMKQLYTNGDIVFPLEISQFLTDIKLGKLDYVSVVGPFIDQLMDDVEELTVKSNYPVNVNMHPWRNFLLDIYNEKDYTLELNTVHTVLH